MATTTSLDLTELGKEAQQAGRTLATLSTARKNEALEAMAAELVDQSARVLEANDRDVADARAEGMDEAIVDRLLLTEERVQKLADSLRQVAELPDPVGSELESRLLENGMRLSKRRIPIGVVGVIYEARPNVTIDIAALCLKTGNTSILRGGSETLRSNLALVEVIQNALERVDLPGRAVQYVSNPDRELVGELLTMDEYVDMIVPRGGPGLHRLCKEESTMPVITGGIGICHVFVDESADLERAVDVVENAKVQRPSVCNALDTLLVHETVAEEFLPKVADRLAESDVELRATEGPLQILEAAGTPASLEPAGSEDFDQEWLGLILGIDTVEDVEEAITHVQDHSTQHSDSILTTDWHNANRFVDAIDSAAVYVNASTRFTDGGEFGLGAEVAVSTQKLHARGPMGLEELTTYKWIGYGDGHLRS